MKKIVVREKHRPARVGIRWRLFACLALFAVLILFVLWLFQFLSLQMQYC